MALLKAVRGAPQKCRDAVVGYSSELPREWLEVTAGSDAREVRLSCQPGYPLSSSGPSNTGF